MSHVRCPSCKLSLAVRAAIPPRYCPRCIARFARAIPLVEPPERDRIRFLPAPGVLRQQAADRAGG